MAAGKALYQCPSGPAPYLDNRARIFLRLKQPNPRHPGDRRCARVVVWRPVSTSSKPILVLHFVSKNPPIRADQKRGREFDTGGETRGTAPHDRLLLKHIFAAIANSVRNTKPG